MWMLWLMLGTAMAAQVESDEPQVLKPDEMAAGLGVQLGSNAVVGAVGRLRWPSAVSVELFLGTGLGLNRSTEPFQDVMIEQTAQQRSGLIGAQLRLPVVRGAQTEVLASLGVEGQLSRANTTTTSPLGDTITTDATSRSGSAYLGMAIDHWMTRRCSVTLGWQAMSLRASNTTTNTDGGPPDGSPTRLGITSRLSVGVTGYF